ncbi:MAG: VWA domain-containing protein [Hyphomicrobiales bacterium]
MTKNNKINQVFLSKLSAFVSNATGQISMMFALLLIPLAAFIGGALDFTQQISYTNKLQATLDSVSIAVAKEIARDSTASDASLEAIAYAIYNVNITNPTNVSTSPFTINRSNGILTVMQNGSLKTSFMGLVGTPTLPINVVSTVNIQRKDVELALILDTTGSMRGQKLKDLKSASRELVNTLLDGGEGLASVRIGLVPWSTGVNVWDDRKTTIKKNTSGKHYCASSRKTAKDVSPATENLPYAYGNIEGYTDRWGNFIITNKKPEQCPNRQIVPLTDKKATLIDEIGKWSANYWTASDVGLTWGWGVLSPKWNDYWDAENQAKPYHGDAKKFAILMTDGDNTLEHVKSNKRSKKLCKAMKKEGIQIYTIAFKVSTSDAVKLMKKCASKPDMYINASSGDSLKEAFERIADEVGSFYISG